MDSCRLFGNFDLRGRPDLLENGFRHIKTLSPGPDNIILITDGLPTQGQKPTSRSTISGADRVKLFIKAVKKLPTRIPVNTILLPMEGDPVAAMLFWRLAADSSGSFFTPAKYFSGRCRPTGIFGSPGDRRQKIQLAVSCLLPDGQPLSHAGGNAGCESFTGNAAVERRIYPKVQSPA